MLVLTRKKDQTLIIGDDIEITVLDIQGDQIRLGVNAPKSIKIYRKELFAEISAENRSAAKPNTPSAANIQNVLRITDPKAARLPTTDPIANAVPDQPDSNGVSGNPTPADSVHEPK